MHKTLKTSNKIWKSPSVSALTGKLVVLRKKGCNGEKLNTELRQSLDTQDKECQVSWAPTWHYFSHVGHQQRDVVFRDLLIFPLSRSVADQRRQRSFADISTLDSLGQRLINSAYADSNQRNLHSHIKSYLSFCDLASVVPFPVTVTLITSYSAYQVSLGRAYGTILNRLIAVSNICTSFSGISWPGIAIIVKTFCCTELNVI